MRYINSFKIYFFLFLCIVFTYTSKGQAGRVISLSSITHDDIDMRPPQGGQFGSAIVSVGDIDGDGIEDIAVGAPRLGPSTNQGVVYVLFLNRNGTVKDTSKIGFGLGGFAGAIGSQSRFGASLAFLGDLDSDGTFELAVGSPKKTVQSASEGSVWILSINSSGIVQKSTEITTGKGGFTGTLSVDEGFGFSLASMNDVDNDGIKELLVGAPDKSVSGTDDGQIYLLRLNGNSSVKGFTTYDNTSNFLNLSSNFRLGQSIAATTDLDGNGVPEIIVGLPGGGRPVPNTGGVWIVFLDSQLNISSVKKIDHQSMNFPVDVDTLARLGYAVTNLKDIDGDGNDDIAVGLLDGKIDSISTNLIALLFLNAQGDLVNSSILLAKSGEPFKGFINPGLDFSGSVIANLNDLNGDGKRDLVAGASLFDNSHGQIHILTLDGVSRIGVDEETVEKNQISIFPNPTSGKIQLSFSGELLKKELRVILLDAVGRRLLDKEFQTFNSPPLELELNQRPGIYYLRIQGEGYEYTDKIIIQN